MADGEKWILERIADGFDRIHRDNMRFFDEGTQMNIQEMQSAYGSDHWRTQGAAVLGGLTYAFLDFSQSFVGGFLDTLRLGETIYKPSYGAVVRDGLRLISVGGAAFKIFKAVKLRAAFNVPGGTNSCASTASTRALRLTGTKMNARIGDVLEGINEHGTNQLLTEIQVLSKEHQGMTPEMLQRLYQNLSKAGLKMKRIENQIEYAQDVGAVVERTGKPVLFNVQSVPQRHMMLAYKDAKGVLRVSDQTGAAHPFYEYAANYGMTFDVFLLENATILHPGFDFIGAAAQTARTAGQSATWAELIGVPVTVVGQPFMNAVESEVRSRLAKMKSPAASPSAAPPQTGAKPKIINFAGLTPITTSSPTNSDNPTVQHNTVYKYKIKKGDTMFGLAKKYYGNAEKYRFIQTANADLLMRLKGDQQMPVETEIIIPGN